MFVEQMFDMLAFHEAKLEGKGEFEIGCQSKDVRNEQREREQVNEWSY